MYASKHGFVPNGLAPRVPTQWSIITQIGTIRVGTVETKIFELDCRGWDKLGIRITATGLTGGDTVTVELNSPEGATYQSFALSPSGTGTSQSAHGVTTSIIDIQSPRYVLSGLLTSPTGTTETEVTINAFLKAGSYA
jgi:hypothetical protein